MAALLIDLDGTLIDPAPGIVAGCRFALNSLGREAPAGDDLLWMIGPPIRASFARLLGGDAQVEAAIAAYRAYIAGGGLTEAEIYQGVPEALAALQDAHDGALFVWTSKSAPFARATIESFGLAGYFRGIYGAELGGRLEDKGDLMEHVLRSERLDPGNACAIGDRSFDVVAALRHGIPTVGVTWGYGSEAELRSAGAKRLCTAPSGLSLAVSEALALHGSSLERPAETSVRIAGDADAPEVISILHEAAAWMARKGTPAWDIATLNQDFVQAFASRSELIVASQGQRIVGVCTLSPSDPDFWPDAPDGVAAYLHKLAVRRTHAGGGVSSALIAACREIARQRGRSRLRLDCHPALRGLYERLGFVHYDTFRPRTDASFVVERFELET